MIPPFLFLKLFRLFKVNAGERFEYLNKKLYICSGLIIFLIIKYERVVL